LKDELTIVTDRTTELERKLAIAMDRETELETELCTLIDEDRFAAWRAGAGNCAHDKNEIELPIATEWDNKGPRAMSPGGSIVRTDAYHHFRTLKMVATRTLLLLLTMTQLQSSQIWSPMKSRNVKCSPLQSRMMAILCLLPGSQYCLTSPTATSMSTIFCIMRTMMSSLGSGTRVLMTEAALELVVAMTLMRM
jgi:hypothetical protein